MAKQEVTYDSIIKEINSRQFAPVYYLMGEETYYIDRLSDYIAEHVLTEEEQARIDNHVKITRQEYIHKWCHLAIENRELYGIPASITLGQAILESGYGNSHLSILTNNHFNIKCKNT